MRLARPFRLLVLPAVLLISVAGTAVAQLQTGDLYGRIIDTEGDPLPGVSVTISGVQAPMQQWSDADGRFRFLGLAPGTYQLVAQLDGFSNVEYSGVVVRLGGKAELELIMSAAMQEVITVTGEGPLLNQRQYNRGANISARELDKIPTARDPWSLLSQAPGVVTDRINVGGNESGQQSIFNGLGSRSSENTFAVDGVVMTDMAAIGGSLTYFDFGAFEEVQLSIGTGDVTAAAAGVTVNQVTKRGTNDWRASARYLRTDGGLQSSSPEIGGLSGNEIDLVEEYGADIGGPLWKDHLWIWAAYGESDIGNLVVGGQLDRTQLEDFNVKLNFQPVQQNNGVLHYWTNDKLKDGRGAGPDRMPETTHDQTTPADIWKFEDSHVFGSTFFVTGLWSTNDGVFTLSPKGGRDADVYWDADGVLHGSYWDFTQTAVIDQARVEGNYFVSTGDISHELRFGGGFREQENASGSIYPRGKIVFACEAFGCDPGAAGDNALVQYWRDKSVAITSTYDSAWVQDTLSKDRWTVNLGLRYDLQKVENTPSTSPANPFQPDLIPELAFAGNDAGGFEWETIVPRVGATYAVGKERKTLVRGTFSRYAEQLSQGLASRVSPLGYAYAAFYFTDANGNLVVDPDETGSLSYYYYYNFDPDDPTAVSTPNSNDPSLDPVMTDEFTFGVEHSLRPDFALGATLTYRQATDIPETRLVILDEGGAVRYATRSDYELAGTVEAQVPGRGEVSVPYYELREGLTQTGGAFLTNGSREHDFRSLTLTATKRLANRWSLRGHLTLCDWDWSVGEEFRLFDDPTDILQDSSAVDSTLFGYSDSDDIFAEVSGGSGNKGDVWMSSGWSFNVVGLYQVAPEKRWGFNLAGSVTGREGFPTPPYVPVGRNNVQLAAIDDIRNPDIYMLSARIDKDFEFGDFRLNLSLDGFNLLNEDYVLQRQRNLSVGSANEVEEVMSPRVFRVGVRLDFR